MRPSQDIKPISYLKANSGKDYENLRENLALLKILSMGKKSIEAGKASPVDAAFARLRAKRKGKNMAHFLLHQP